MAQARLSAVQGLVEMAKSLKQRFVDYGTRNNTVYTKSNPDPARTTEQPSLIEMGQARAKKFLTPSRSIQDVMIDRAMAGETPEQYIAKDYGDSEKKEYRKGGKVKPRGVGCAQRGHGKGRMR